MACRIELCEGLELALRVAGTKQLKRLARRRGGERQDRQVRLAAAGSELDEQRVGHTVLLVVVEVVDVTGAEKLLEVLGRLAGLRGVGLSRRGLR